MTGPVHIVAFTDNGIQLAQRLAVALGGTAVRSADAGGVHAWAEQHFKPGNSLVFVGALGIAVRAIAPYVSSKASDPAVVVVDERAAFAIAVLSGHLGGANRLAQSVAEACGASPVITTATDVTGCFAVDVWAADHGCSLEPLSAVKPVSSKLLAGETIVFKSQWPITGTTPDGVTVAGYNQPHVADEVAGYNQPHSTTSTPDVVLSHLHEPGPWLKLTPKIVVLGVGCRRGTTCEEFEAALRKFLQASVIDEDAITAVATIDLKADEPGLLDFCSQHGWDLHTFSAEQLATVPGVFSASDFVEHVTGVDNVCERACVCASEGELLHPKTVHGPVTIAAALRPFHPDWGTWS